MPAKPRSLRPAIASAQESPASLDDRFSCGNTPENNSSTAGQDASAGCPEDHTDLVYNTTSSSYSSNDLEFPDFEIPSDFMPDLFDVPDLPMLNFGMTLPPLDGPTTDSVHLEQRTRTFQQGALTAKMLYSKLVKYTRVMAEAVHLPPFIYPPCWLSGTPSTRCPIDCSHRCLPEALAVCSNLTQMYYVRRIGSEGFVWQQICTHLKQLRDSVGPPCETCFEYSADVVAV